MLTKPGYLTRVIKNIKVGEYSKISPISMWPGDFNGDNAINMSDIIEIAKGFNCSEGNELYVAECDINKDGVINLKDSIFVAKHFNATSY